RRVSAAADSCITRGRILSTVSAPPKDCHLARRPAFPGHPEGLRLLVRNEPRTPQRAPMLLRPRPSRNECCPECCLDGRMCFEGPLRTCCAERLERCAGYRRLPGESRRAAARRSVAAGLSAWFFRPQCAPQRPHFAWASCGNSHREEP